MSVWIKYHCQKSGSDHGPVQFEKRKKTLRDGRSEPSVDARKRRSPSRFVSFEQPESACGKHLIPSAPPIGDRSSAPLHSVHGPPTPPSIISLPSPLPIRQSSLCFLSSERRGLLTKHACDGTIVSGKYYNSLAQLHRNFPAFGIASHIF